MNPRICKCCGQAIVTKASPCSPNPNLCDACAGVVESIDAEKFWTADQAACVPVGAPEGRSQFSSRSRKGAKRGR